MTRAQCTDKMALSKPNPFVGIAKLKLDVDSHNVPKYCGLCLRCSGNGGVRLIDSHIFPQAVFALAHPHGVYHYEQRQVFKAQSLFKAKNFRLCKKMDKRDRTADCEVGRLQNGETAFLDVCRKYLTDRKSSVELTYNEHLYRGVVSIAYRALLEYNLPDHELESMSDVAVNFLFDLRKATFNGLEPSDCEVHLFASFAGPQAPGAPAYNKIFGDYLFNDAGFLVGVLRAYHESYEERHFYILVRFKGLHFVIVPSRMLGLLKRAAYPDLSMRVWQEVQPKQGSITVPLYQDRITHCLVNAALNEVQHAMLNLILSVHGTDAFRYKGKTESIELTLGEHNFISRIPSDIRLNPMTGALTLKNKDSKAVFNETDRFGVATTFFDLGKRLPADRRWLLIKDTPATERRLRFILSWYVRLDKDGLIDCRPACKETLGQSMYDLVPLDVTCLSIGPYLGILKNASDASVSPPK